MKTKRFFSIVCLTVALSVNSLPVHAQSFLEAYVLTLRFLNTAPAQQMLQTLLQATTSQPETTSQPQGVPVYSDGEWVVVIRQDGNDLTYYGVNVNSKADIMLRNATFQGNQELSVYSWNNGGTIYQIAYQPNDLSSVRLQVFEGSELLLDRLLTRYILR